MKNYKKLLIVICVSIIAFSFGGKQSSYEVVSLESQYEVTLWLNNNRPSEVIDIETTGTLWWIFYKK